MNPGLVIQRVLYKLEGRQAETAQEHMVGSTRGFSNHRVRAKASKWIQPLVKDRYHREIPFGVNAADLAGTVVNVEIARKVREAGQNMHGIRIGQKIRRQPGFLRIRGRRSMSEMAFDIGARAQQSFFFAGPEGEANRALGPHTDGGQNARRLHHHRAARPVVGSAIPGDPAIQMRTGHDIARARIIARKVSENIVGVVICVLEVHAAFDFEPHLTALRQAREFPIIFGCQLHCRKLCGFPDAICITFAVHQSAVAARHLYQGNCALLRQEFVQVGPKVKPLQAFFPLGRIEGRLFEFVEFDKVGLAEPVERYIAIVFRRCRPCHQDDLAGQFSLPLGKVLFAAHGSDDDRRRHDAVRCGSPGDGNGA